MQVTVTTTIDESADAIIVDLDLEGGFSPGGKEVDRILGGLLSDLVKRGELSGKLGDTGVVHHATAGLPKLIVVAGIGPRGSAGQAEAAKASGAAIKVLTSKARGQLLVAFPETWTREQWEAVVAGAFVAAEGQDLYRKQKRLQMPRGLKLLRAPVSAVDSGTIIGRAVNFARQLINQPPNIMNPAALAEAARAMASRTGLECEIWDRERLIQERCHALLAVAAGSAAEPRLVILRHRGNQDSEPDLALIGKGVTFDSGGLSIKPSDSMKEMKCDMSGAASVLAAMQAAAELKVPRHVIGLIGAVENMLGDHAYKLGDVITARSGKTIEILNTDAEGRVVLADVLDVATDLKPKRIIDLATLTGACVVALGTEITGVMTNQQGWADQVLAASKRSGEPFWQLPMHDFFAEQIRSQVADIKNVGEGRWGGAMTAAKFLQEFVKDLPWVHLDIAGPAFGESAKPWRDGGATGVPVRTLIELLRNG